MHAESREHVQADGHQGFEAGAPYDAIHVGAAPEFIPKSLLEQLKPGGRLVIPVGQRHDVQQLTVVDKLPDGTILNRGNAVDVRFVPLIPRNPNGELAPAQPPGENEL